MSFDNEISFRSIPLVNVEMALLMSVLQAPTLEEVMSVQSSLGMDFPVLRDLWLPNHSLISSPQNLVPGATWLGSTGNQLDLRASQAVAAWWSNGSNVYGKYESLRRPLEQVLQIISPPVRVVRITYNLVIPSVTGINVWDHINPQFFPQIVDGDVPTMEISAGYITREKVTFRYQLTGGDDQLQITTTGALFTEDKKPLERLDLVHSSMKIQFLQMISDLARESWGLNA